MADDIDFEKAMSGVRRLKKESAALSPTRPPSNPKLRAEIRNRAMHSSATVDEIEQLSVSDSNLSSAEDEETLYFLSDGVQKKVLRELKRGTRYSIEYTLDLHGLTQQKAQQEIDTALLTLEAAQSTCILIIHGKGLHSNLGAPLKVFCARYLKTLRPVKAYCSARQNDGGTGALYVLIKGDLSVTQMPSKND